MFKKCIFEFDRVDSAWTGDVTGGPITTPLGRFLVVVWLCDVSLVGGLSLPSEVTGRSVQTREPGRVAGLDVLVQVAGVPSTGNHLGDRLPSSWNPTKGREGSETVLAAITPTWQIET